ncbi:MULTISPECIES: GspH/FimT family pseudopilin [Stenotrophomonas]|jgi:type IV fimbrial biogenesis protein FimT|uniref:Type II secretion system protein H n=3 Tax=Stenotrophomonas TaxID=40323 RepID=A0AAX1IE26_STEMA|nr:MULTISPECIES: GspH/FimT family pseudopilin [Stenotrophomonas]MCO5738666.1 GspH/FimT family pseudopilin [Stenotrophomonas maltophilia]QNG77547.1 hypothetical protein GPNADHDJ_01743 [Stenotrophomonas maltophilia]
MRTHRSSGCAASRGMHLIEILVVTAVLAVLLAAGWPSLQALLLHQRAEATRFSLQAALATARTQAIMRRELIGLCASADGQRCGDDWSQGWIAYRAAGAWQPPSTADAIVLHQGGRPDVTINAASNSGRPQLYFQPDGRSPGSNLTLRVCVRGREHARIIVSNSGRMRSSTTRTGQAC